MMLRALVVFFLAVGAFEVVATALGKLSLVAGLGAICLAVFFAGVLHGMRAMQQDLRALLTLLREQRVGDAARPPK
jgi:hypothetical protein